MKTKIFLTTVFLYLFSLPVYSGTYRLTSGSLEALRNYCVYSPSTPAPDGMCNGIFAGIFESKGNCRCGNSQYLVWDENLRRCKPKCPEGFYVKQQKSGKCDDGQYKLKIEKK